MAAATVEQMVPPGEAYGSVEPSQTRTPAFRFSFNSASVLVSLCVPWVYFICLFGLASSEWHSRCPWVVWVIEVVLLVFNLCLLYWAFLKVRAASKGDDNREPTWVLFMAASLLFAWIAAMTLGNLQFAHVTQNLYQWQMMNVYQEVDVSKPGDAMMDAAMVHFQPGTEVQLDNYAGFHNRDTYCVAPLKQLTKTLDGNLVVGDVNGTESKQTWDYWVVGLNCCVAHGNRAFNCGPRADINPEALEVKAGLRMLRDQDRPFYRLAIDQAEAATGIKVTHPLMFYWVEDPVKNITHLRDGSMKWYAIIVIVHFVFQALCVRFALWHFASQSRVVRRAFG